MRISISTDGGGSFDHVGTITKQVRYLSPADETTTAKETTPLRESFQKVLNKAAESLVEEKKTVAENARLSHPDAEAVDLDSIFTEASETYGVDKQLLLAVAKQESNFRSDAVSRSGAVGIMQLMPDTAKGLGVTDSYDPYQNIMGGAKYLSSKLREWDGDISLALASYNAGSGAVRRYGGIPPYEETENYVKKVTAYYADPLLSAPEQNTGIPDDVRKAERELKKAQELQESISELPGKKIYDSFITALQNELIENGESPDGAEVDYMDILKYSDNAIKTLLKKE